jgi:hypothetical protein
MLGFRRSIIFRKIKMKKLIPVVAGLLACNSAHAAGLADEVENRF